MSDTGIAETLAAMRPEAVALAETVSFAVLVDRPLLRQARVQLVPEADAGTEADVWLSDLVKSRSRDGITFTPEAAAALRARLARDAGRTEEAWKLTMAVHDHLPPTLKLEEKINRLSIDASEDAAREIDDLLSSVLAAMASGGRDGLASWAARALAAFPTSVRKRPAARMLAAGATLRLGGDPRATLDGAMPEWLRFVAPPNLPMANIGVQLANRLLRLDAGESPAGQLLRLPATAPYLIDVAWTLAGGKEDGHQIALRPGDVQHFDVGADEIRLRTVNGDVYGLRAGGTTPAEVRPYIIDFSEVLDRAGNRRVSYAQQLAARTTPQITILTGPEGSGKTTTLAQVVRRLEAAEVACAYHFFERGTPRLEYWDFAQRSLIAQLMTRYDAPAWAITMTLFDFLRLIETRVGTGPVHLVLDNVDAVRDFGLADFAGAPVNLPPQFMFLLSSEAVPEQFDRSVIDILPLEASPKKAPPRLPDRGSSARRYLEALAVARAPLPLGDADRLRASVDLNTIDVEPWTQRRSHLGEPSITFTDAMLRADVVAQLNENTEREAHHQLASALFPKDEDEDESWYGLYHGAWHRQQAGEIFSANRLLTSMRRLQNLIERFGAPIAADVLDEVRRATVRNVAS